MSTYLNKVCVLCAKHRVTHPLLVEHSLPSWERQRPRCHTINTCGAIPTLIPLCGTIPPCGIAILTLICWLRQLWLRLVRPMFSVVKIHNSFSQSLSGRLHSSAPSQGLVQDIEPQHLSARFLVQQAVQKLFWDVFQQGCCLRKYHL
jgi:hypothetical protein